jgi:hypothetical protein
LGPGPAADVYDVNWELGRNRRVYVGLFTVIRAGCVVINRRFSITNKWE